MTHPQLMLAMKAHVIFTLDGSTPHRDLAYQHRSRRSQCKGWWNDRWRDLMLAAMASLSGGEDEIEVPLRPDCCLRLGTRPIEFTAPLSYHDDDVKALSDEQIPDDEDIDEAEQDDIDGDEQHDG